jgi:AcrR family transcriptional regulator
MPEKGPTPQQRSAAARARLMEAASELFYKEGVNAVPIERVLEHAGVAKATLYSAFGSKEGLVRAYLRARHAATSEEMARELEARYRTPKERLIGVFEVQGLSFTNPGFRGCAFLSANAQAPAGSVDEETSDYRAWIHQLFFDLAQQAGAKDPKSLAKQLVVLYDGAGISAWMDHDPSAETAARTVATALVDAAITSS